MLQHVDSEIRSNKVLFLDVDFECLCLTATQHSALTRQSSISSMCASVRSFVGTWHAGPCALVHYLYPGKRRMFFPRAVLVGRRVFTHVWVLAQVRLKPQEPSFAFGLLCVLD